MSVLNRVLYRLTAGLPLRVIMEDGRPYLERYYVGTLLGTRVYVHRFVGSDPDRGLHDHPWPWAGSLVLSGEYLELLEGRQRVVRWFNWLRGDTFHRVILPSGTREVWTIFFHRAKNTKRWGFQRGARSAVADASGQNVREWWLMTPAARVCQDRLPVDSYQDI